MEKARLVEIKSCVGECPYCDKDTHPFLCICTKVKPKKFIKNNGKFPEVCPLPSTGGR